MTHLYSTEKYLIAWQMQQKSSKFPGESAVGVTGGAERTAALPVTSVFGGPVYSSVHWLDICAPRKGFLPYRAGAGSGDQRI